MRASRTITRTTSSASRRGCPFRGSSKAKSPRWRSARSTPSDLPSARRTPTRQGTSQSSGTSNQKSPLRNCPTSSRSPKIWSNISSAPCSTNAPMRSLSSTVLSRRGSKPSSNTSHRAISPSAIIRTPSPSCRRRTSSSNTPSTGAATFRPNTKNTSPKSSSSAPCSSPTTRRRSSPSI